MQTLIKALKKLSAPLKSKAGISSTGVVLIAAFLIILLGVIAYFIFTGVSLFGLFGMGGG